MGEYKRPNDNIHDLLKKEILQILKRGVYIVNTSTTTRFFF